MVKASELRLGNLISHPYGPSYVTMIRGNDLGLRDSQGALWCTVTDNVKGIELTEELMIKLGFEYLSEPVPDAENPFKQNFGHDFYKNGKIKLQSHYRSFTEKTLTIWASEEHQIYYVHQLQNLFFSLTGRELELTK